VPSVCLDSKGTVGTIIKWKLSSTDDVCNGNRRPLNSRHTAVCCLQLNRYMCRSSQSTFIAFRTTVPGVLADSLLHCFLVRDGRDHEHIQQYISEFVQSCDASKQLLQGEKQKQFYRKENSSAFCVPQFCNHYCYFLHIPCEIILFNFAFSHQNLLITV
jgi:hypothetical protein